MILLLNHIVSFIESSITTPNCQLKDSWTSTVNLQLIIYYYYDILKQFNCWLYTLYNHVDTIIHFEIYEIK